MADHLTIYAFDPFMTDPLVMYAKKGRGVPSYLSSTIDEFVLQISVQGKT